MTLVPLEIMLDPSLRVLSPLLAAIAHPATLAATGTGLPAGSVEVGRVNAILAATPCAQPIFHDRMVSTCARLNCDVALARTGLHPEALDPVTVDLALCTPEGPCVAEGLAFFRDVDRALWLVPSNPDRFYCVAVGPRGLVLTDTPPYLDADERIDGLCRAASEIVRLTLRRGR